MLKAHRRRLYLMRSPKNQSSEDSTEVHIGKIIICLPLLAPALKVSKAKYIYIHPEFVFTCVSLDRQNLANGTGQNKSSSNECIPCILGKSSSFKTAPSV